MNISIDNFRGLEHAEIETGNLTLIAGLNETGKSSALQAIGAALTGSEQPVEDLGKAEKKFLVRGDSAQSTIFVQSDAGSIGLTYPGGKRSIEGKPDEISEYSAGIKSICTDAQKTRAEVISELIKSLPTMEELDAELISKGIPAGDGMKRLKTSVQVSGWDGAYDKAKSTGAQLKGKWEAISGANYGCNTAASWEPAAWEPDLQNKNTGELIADHVKEVDWLKVAETDEAVSQTVLTDLQEKIALIPALDAELKDLSAQEVGIKKSGEILSATVAALPKPDQYEVHACPHCKGNLAIESGKIIIPTVLAPEEIEKRKTAILTGNAGLADLRVELRRLRDEIATKTSQLNAAYAAQKKHAELSVKTGNSSDAQAIADIRARVARAQARIDAKKQKTEADKCAADIVMNQNIIDVLAPNGLRQQKLHDALAGYSAHLNQVSKSAGWGTVEIRPDMSIWYDSLPYAAQSKSGKLRIRIIFQVAGAIISGESMVIIDECDMLDAPSRNGLMKMLISCGLKSVIGMTLKLKEDMPDLSKFGGVSYWVEGGKI